jgi:hypothetical protein
VFVYPDSGDIVLAGPAEGWTVNEQGEVVGRTTGQPVLQLDDLMVALRTAEAAASGDGITCSIDPTEEGLARFQRLVATRRPAMSSAALRMLERALGPSVITVTGVEADTHFAQVMVAADFLMKRLAMNFEPAPVDDLPSYLELLQRRTAGQPASAIFRLWLAPHYDSVLHAPDRLAWQLEGPAVRALTEDSLLAAGGRVVDLGTADPVAEQWAGLFNEKYDALAVKLPAFAELRNCVDLAVVGAILAKERMFDRAGYQAPLLTDAKLVDVARYNAPRSTPTRASFVKQGQQYFVSLSGGVDLDTWAVLDDATARESLAAVRARSAPARRGGWWWD